MATKVVGDVKTLKKIGNTSLVKLNSLSSTNVIAYAKLELYNPFGSVKDRAAYWMIKDGEEQFDKALKEALYLSEVSIL